MMRPCAWSPSDEPRSFGPTDRKPLYAYISHKHAEYVRIWSHEPTIDDHCFAHFSA